MPHVFISYAKKDTRALAEALFTALNAVPGISAWMDRVLEPDTSWAAQIQHEIERCDYMVVLLSPDVNRAVTATQRRSFVLNEIDYAQQENKPILPVMVQSTKMPVQIVGIQYIDLTHRPTDPSPIVERVCRRFNILISPAFATVPTIARQQPVRAPMIIGAVVGLAVIAVLVLVLLNRMNRDAAPTPTMGAVPTTALTLDPLSGAIERAKNFVGGNRDWETFLYTFPDDPASSRMALVPVGTFMMGSDLDETEQPIHLQQITQPFWIDRTEVTRQQYQFCVNAGRCNEKLSNEYSDEDTDPVNAVTWFEAVDYCQWHGSRPPTEVEWEYAARGPDSWLYPWGNNWVDNYAAWGNIDYQRTSVVASRPQGASWVGAMDMSGNVMEWVSSLYMPYPYDISHESPNDANTERSIRGGAFDFFFTETVRASGRTYTYPDYIIYVTGFRCARSVE